MAKKIYYGEEARQKLLKGVDTLSNAVSQTLGAKGTNVLIETPYVGYPQTTKDGVTVAKAIEVADLVEAQAVQLMKHNALMTNKAAGDGTTTSIVLGAQMFHEGMSIIENSDETINNAQFLDGMQTAVSLVVEAIKDQAVLIKGDNNLQENVATISANNDPHIGGIVSDALSAVGDMGAIKVTPSLEGETYYSVSEGFTLEGGVMTTMMLPPMDTKAVLKEPFILVSDSNIASLNTILSDPTVAQPIISKEKGLVVICSDMDTLLLQELTIRNKRDGMQIYAVKAPSFGLDRTNQLFDLATVVGGKLIGGDTGTKLDEVSKKDLGSAYEVIIEEDKVTFVEGYGNEEEIKKLIEETSAKVKVEKDPDVRKEIEERISRIKGSVATIHIDATSEVEYQEIQYRVEDAINATKAALKEGVVVGGGIALLVAQHKVKGGVKDKSSSFLMGFNTVVNSLHSPFITILQNAGVPSTHYTSMKTKFVTEKHMGYNANTDTIENIFEAGVIDPAAVTIAAVQSAAKVAGILLTTSVVIVNEGTDE